MQLRGAHSNNVLAEQEDGVPASASHLARVSTASHLPSSFSDQRKEKPSRSSTDWWDERVARACCTFLNVLRVLQVCDIRARARTCCRMILEERTTRRDENSIGNTDCAMSTHLAPNLTCLRFVVKKELFLMWIFMYGHDRLT